MTHWSLSRSDLCTASACTAILILFGKRGCLHMSHKIGLCLEAALCRARCSFSLVCVRLIDCFVWGRSQLHCTMNSFLFLFPCVAPSIQDFIPLPMCAFVAGIPIAVSNTRVPLPLHLSRRCVGSGCAALVAEPVVVASVPFCEFR
jgi:hypothetical protein